MKIEGKNPDSGESFQTDENHVDRDFIVWASTLEMSDAKIKSIIENLNISADSKLLLFAFSKVTIQAGEFVIKIARKIVDFICRLFSEYPSTSFGIIFGAIAGFLIATVPLLGVVLGPIVTPILIGLGMLLGIKEDIKDKALSRKIAEINAQFAPLHV